jgi:PBP1b-binding outer membrane lipoprotein LpoB
MTKRLALVGVMTLAMLAACSKQAPPPADDEAEPAARAEKPAPPPVDREKMAQDMLGLIDTAPQCQQYRTQLEEVSKRPPDQVTTDDMSGVVAQAYKAGCGKKR